MKTIKDLANRFNETDFLLIERENTALKETVTKLLAEVDRLSGLDRKSFIQLKITAAEEIIETLLTILNTRSRTQELTLEEAKKLDIYVKNQKLLKENPEGIDTQYKDLSTEKSTDELMLLAESKDDEQQSITSPS